MYNMEKNSIVMFTKQYMSNFFDYIQYGSLKIIKYNDEQE